jgi:hypothetical protein
MDELGWSRRSGLGGGRPSAKADTATLAASTRSTLSTKVHFVH